MKAYECTVCGYLYDDETAEINNEGMTIPFEDLEAEWVCPVCGVKPDLFAATLSDRTHDIAVEQGESEE